jgi:predicted secreted hydrolase
MARTTIGCLGLDLVLSPGKGPTLHGRSGYSPKGSQAGNATYYYSFSRMPTRGRLAVSGRSVEVEGDSWMDHEFGTSFLEEQQVGWDWFSIQLEDGRDLMLFQLRRKDGLKDPHSSGTLIGNARTESITHDEFELIPGRIWKSRASGASYPVEWRIRIPKLGIELQIRAALEGQELRTGRSTGVNYWEGAVTVQGGGGGSAPVRGRGYLEMTGYSGAPISRVLR